MQSARSIAGLFGCFVTDLFKNVYYIYSSPVFHYGIIIINSLYNACCFT